MGIPCVIIAFSVRLKLFQNKKGFQNKASIMKGKVNDFYDIMNQEILQRKKKSKLAARLRSGNIKMAPARDLARFREFWKP